MGQRKQEKQETGVCFVLKTKANASCVICSGRSGSQLRHILGAVKDMNTDDKSTSDWNFVKDKLIILRF